MNDDKTLLPRDEFQIELRSLEANPGAISKQSTIDVADDYGNVRTWVVRTVREDGVDRVFLQVIGADRGDRLFLPPAVTSVLARQRDAIVDAVNKRRARTAAATRKAKRAEGRQ